MRNKIRLDTMKDIRDFCEVVNTIDADVYLMDKKNQYKVNAKSQLSCMMAGAEWAHIEVYCEEDIYTKIKEWVID